MSASSICDRCPVLGTPSSSCSLPSAPAGASLSIKGPHARFFGDLKTFTVWQQSTSTFCCRLAPEGVAPWGTSEGSRVEVVERYCDPWIAAKRPDPVIGLLEFVEGALL